MILSCYHVDAFASAVFHGNPAAVCPMEAWLPDATPQSLAVENNLSETAFVIPRDDDFDCAGLRLRPKLTFAATLAAAFVLFTGRGVNGNSIRFHSRSGWVMVADGAIYSRWIFLRDPPRRAARLRLWFTAWARVPLKF